MADQNKSFTNLANQLEVDLQNAKDLQHIVRDLERDLATAKNNETAAWRRFNKSREALMEAHPEVRNGVSVGPRRVGEPES